MQWKLGKFSELQTDDMEELATSMLKKISRLVRDNKVNLMFVKKAQTFRYHHKINVYYYNYKNHIIYSHFHKRHINSTNILRTLTEFLTDASGGVLTGPPAA